ncbi:Gfo/Idh/MocA family oxidoreductase [Klebsiella grimontii]|uniref:Gfo/Idh/MocA family oxidoreductase n=1 Tax=Klebsiella grimontii TaxID=2058152 RepID=UPI00116D43CD|nr:Gfo/Idh/MocA family oxidoreductase [Klebsiella grimontii]VUS47098.1 Inositol 2-dehydrogenase/D-chiro-inositol 3-dehydrogenase [Klebsiella grimontii]
MNVLIIGFGYAGRRYQRAFSHLASKNGVDLTLAYVGRKSRTDVKPYYTQIGTALTEFRPDIVVVSVNDHSHVAVLRELASFEGFIICEKPLAVPSDDWSGVCAGLSHIKGFALDLVERYSEATERLKEIVSQRQWSLVRSSFYWGKDRLNDYRPTCGVTSEIIHALDLVKWICTSQEPLQLQQAIGIGSDFSISGDSIPDTVLLTATLGNAPVAGYSSFVNIQRQRTVDFTFADPDGRIFHARIVYDTPNWDHDYLRIWSRDVSGYEVVEDEYRAVPQQSGLETVYKLSLLCDDAMRVTMGNSPRMPLADLEVSKELQSLLDAISLQITALPTARYVRGSERILIPESADLESLG